METSSPSQSWYDPPEYHEIDSCLVCHLLGEHIEEAEYWSKLNCWKCEELLEKCYE